MLKYDTALFGGEERDTKQIFDIVDIYEIG